MAMNLFSAPSWDVDATSEIIRNAPGSSALSKKKRKRKKPIGILERAKKALGISTPKHDLNETSGSNEAFSDANQVIVGKKKKRLRRGRKKPQELIKSSENSNTSDTPEVKTGTEKTDEGAASPASKKMKRRRRKKMKVSGQDLSPDPGNNQLSKLHRILELEEKRDKAMKARDGQGGNPSATDDLAGSELSLAQFNDRNEKKILKKKLRQKKRREKMKEKKREQQEEQKRNMEVTLNSSQKKKMQKVAEDSGQQIGNEEGTTNSSYDNSFTESLPAEGDNDSTASPMNKKKKNKKKKKKKGTDLVDGNVVSASNNIALNSNNSSSKKEVVPLAVEYGEKVQKSVKRKMVISKLMQDSQINAEAPAALEAGIKSKRSKRKKKRAAAAELPQEQPQNEDSKNTLHNLKKRRLLEKEPSLRERVTEQLQSARFRWINEQLYSSNSWDAVQFFKEDPEAFQAYHAGYRNQVAQWPVNPLDVLIQSISRLPSGTVVADFGCGEALLAKSLPTMKVHSLDLVAQTPDVVACDMAHTPLLMESVDVAVFCLSLMGTNLNDFILEANRVLKDSGMLMIAEVESRFEDVDNFTSAMVHFGFNLMKKDLSHQMFIFMEFHKARKVSKTGKLPTLSLDPCIYKKR